jgi:feruloyl esterase
MKLRLTLLTVSVLSLAGCGSGSSSDVGTVSCEALTAAVLDTSSIGTVQLTKNQLVAATANVPQHCRVEGLMSPETGSSIKFATNIPASGWNGRFVMLGNGGYAGGALPAAGADVAAGYATAWTDTGHTATNDGTVFYNNRVSEIDYGYRAVHLTTAVSKQILKRVGGNEPSYSYFNGCSTGGRQALMSAQRYPQDFDGIIAGSPAHELTGLAVEQNWSLRQFQQNNFSGNIFGKVKLLGDAVKAACADAEGIIAKPGTCNFDAASLLCTAGQDPNTCLTTAQVNAVKAVYQGPKSSVGVNWYPGKPVGSEYSWASWLVADSSDPAKWYPAQGGFGFSFAGNLFFETDPAPTYKWTDFDFDLDPPKALYMANILNATDPDLSRFYSRKGKLLVYHGTGDGLIGYQPTLSYYQKVQGRFGDTVTNSFARLFLVPGMDHCDYYDRGGLSISDWLTPLVNWVEKGTAPDSIAARSKASNAISFTRPVCAWPKTATYNGSGDRKEAANWTCS